MAAQLIADASQRLATRSVSRAHHDRCWNKVSVISSACRRSLRKISSICPPIAGSSTISVDSSFSAMDRLSKFIDPTSTTGHRSQTPSGGVSSASNRTRARQRKQPPYSASGVARDVDIRSLAPRQNPNVDTPFRRFDEQVDKAAVRRKVRIGDIQRLSCTGDRQREEALGGGAAEGWS